MKNVNRKNLENKANLMRTNKFNLIVAPAGFGKTTLIRKLDLESNVFKLDVTDEYSTSIKLCRKICLEVFGVDAYNQINLISKKNETESFLIALLCVEAKRRNGITLIFDDYQYIESAEINMLFLRLEKKIPDDLGISIFISSRYYPQGPLGAYFQDNEDCVLGYEDFVFTRYELEDYLKSNDYDFEYYCVEEIYDKSGGWAQGINMLARIYEGEDEDTTELIKNYFENNVLFDYTDIVRNFLKITANLEEIPWELFGYIKDIGRLRKELGIVSKNMNFVFKMNNYYLIHPMLRIYFKENKSDVNTELVDGVVEYLKDKKDYAQLFYIFKSLDMKEETKEIAISLADTHYVERNKDKYFELLDTLPTKDILTSEVLAVNYARFSKNKLDRKTKLEYFGRAIELYKKRLDITPKKKKQIIAEINLFKVLSNGTDYDNMLAEIKDLDLSAIDDKNLYFPREYFNLDKPRPLGMYYKTGEYSNMIHKMQELENMLTGLGHGRMDGITYLCQAEMQYLKGDIKKAEQLIEESLKRAESINQFAVKLSCQYMLVRIYKYQNNRYLAERAINNLNFMIKRKKDEKKYVLKVAKLWFYQKEGTLSEQALLTTYADMHLEEYNNSLCDLCHVEYLLATDRPDEAKNEVNRLISQYREVSQGIGLIYAYIELAFAALAGGSKEESREALLEAIKLADEEGFIMPFVEYQDRMVDLMEVHAKYLPKAFRSTVVKTIDGLVGTVKHKSENRFRLSKREIEVMELLKLGLKNTEIAVELGIRPDTVKEYIHNIFIKLGVSTRLEAVMKYKE